MKLNIGAGNALLEGFTPIDRRLGSEAFPLAYADNTVEEIRASHILEHFNFMDAKKALLEWVRVLKPGGVIKIAVPDFDKIISLYKTDPKWRFYLMGGQTDANDQHLSTWDRLTLFAYMQECGLELITEWQSDGKDTSNHPCSLNLQGRKPEKLEDKFNPFPATNGLPPGKKYASIRACLSCPRVGFNDFWGEALAAFGKLNIPLNRFQGAYWGQCMQNCFEDALKDGIDYLITLDYDSLFTAEHVDTLVKTIIANPDMDAIASLQPRRVTQKALLTLKKGAVKTERGIEIDGKPIPVNTAHFGLTIVRMEALRDIPKPWFKGVPDSSGSWRGDDRLDDDIWFWHQWRLHERTLYVHPDVRIGHMEIMASEFDDEFQPRYISVKQWRDSHKLTPATEAEFGNIERAS